MTAPGPNGGFSVNTQALNSAQTALNGMALDSANIGALANESTETAAQGHRGWDTAAALRASLTEWHEQVEALTARLHKNSAAMQQTSLNYQSTDGFLADPFKAG
ncbi:hypothetical protein ACFVVX_07930 [Kitasatospora sp. NPDC058170]|uniref:hypothetical protein n=1 Tax=Kitasatospora sp. NPDC058170 TaxID=3346364 RepID=UPI0036DDFAD1